MWHCSRAVAHSGAEQDVEGVAPNQSVSLNEATSATADRPPPIGGSPRYIRPRQPGAATALPGLGEDPPWYRSGLGALSIVLAVVGAVYWLARRWMPGVRSVESGVLRVAGRATLTPKHSAALIQLGRRFVLVGVSPERVSLLCEVSDPGEVAELVTRIGSCGTDFPVGHSKRQAGKPVPHPGGGRDFDRLLAGEAAEYCTEAREASNESPSSDRQPPTTGSGPGRATRPPNGRYGPLAELLNRLRVLQAK